MTTFELIKKSDPRFFECTSSEPYIRHKYKIVTKDGKELILDNWTDTAVLWFQSGCGYFFSHIEVLE